MRKRILTVLIATLSLSGISFVSPPAASAFVDGDIVNYSKTVTTAPAPTGSITESEAYWGLAFDSATVYGVSKSSAQLIVSCFSKFTGVACAPHTTIQSPSGQNFRTPVMATSYFDSSTARLFAWATNESLTAGVVIVDYSDKTTPTYVDFIPTSTEGGAPLNAVSPWTSYSSITNSFQVGTKIYALNYVPGSTFTNSASAMMCFDLATATACDGTGYYSFMVSGSTRIDYTLIGVPPQIAKVGTRIYGTSWRKDAGVGYSEAYCFDTVSKAICTGTWPVIASSYTITGSSPQVFVSGSCFYSGGVCGGGAVFPQLDSSGTEVGFCLGGNYTTACYTLNGALTTATAYRVTWPSVINYLSGGLTGAQTAGYVIRGSKIYYAGSGAGGHSSTLNCMDFATGVSCPNFPSAFLNPDYYILDITTVQEDPYDSKCLWVTADRGAKDIQAIDAISGQPCGGSNVAFTNSDYIEGATECTPISYLKLIIETPTAASYTSGSVVIDSGTAKAFNTLTVNKSINGVILAGQSLPDTSTPMTLNVNLTSAPNVGMSLTLHWQGIYHASCVANGQNATALPVTHTISFDANGGGTAPVDSSSPYEESSTATLPGNTSGMSKTGLVFGGWTLGGPDSGTVYSAGETFTVLADATFYAKWLHQLTITAGNVTVNQGTSYSPTASITSGLISGDTATVSSVTYKYVGINGTNYPLSSTPPTGVGEYSIIASSATANFTPVESGTAYTGTHLYISGKLTINAASSPSSGGGTSPAVDPVQLNSILDYSPKFGPVAGGTVVTISGNFPAPLTTIHIDGVILNPSQWKQTINGIVITMPAHPVGPVVIQLYDGQVPLLRPLPYTYQETASPTPTPTPTPTTTPTPKLEVSPLLTEAGKKVVKENQVVKVSQNFSVKLPESTESTVIYVNGKKTKATVSVEGAVKLPGLVGPKDKVQVEVLLKTGETISADVKIQQAPIEIANVNFDLAAYFLTARAKGILDNVIQVVKEHGFTTVTLTGHTDSQGAGKYDNQSLSMNRNKRVVEYLQKSLAKYGVTFKYEAFADARPVASNSNATGQAANRRVDIKVS